jgi:hypothetical protein
MSSEQRCQRHYIFGGFQRVEIIGVLSEPKSVRSQLLIALPVPNTNTSPFVAVQ